MRCFYISLPYATFGIISSEGKIIEAAPIAAWMIGKTLQEIKPWLVKRRAVVKEVF